MIDLLEAERATVLEIRSDKKAYLDQHIPGSVHIPYAEFRGPDKNPGKVPDVTQLANVLGARGIDTNKTVVIVHDGVTPTDFGAAARVYWTLKSVGFGSLAILNGGFRGYQKDGFEIASFWAYDRHRNSDGDATELTLVILSSHNVLANYDRTMIVEIDDFEFYPDADYDDCEDSFDAFPFDEAECYDTDMDGVGDNADPDDDNDGVPDDLDVWPLDNSQSTDTDGDGLADFRNNVTAGDSYDFEGGAIPANMSSSWTFWSPNCPSRSTCEWSSPSSATNSSLTSPKYCSSKMPPAMASVSGSTIRVLVPSPFLD